MDPTLWPPSGQAGLDHWVFKFSIFGAIFVLTWPPSLLHNVAPGASKIGTIFLFISVHHIVSHGRILTLPKAGSLKRNTALEYSTRVVQEGGRRCKKSTLNDLVHLTPLRIPLMKPPLDMRYPVISPIAHPRFTQGVDFPSLFWS